MCASNGVHKTAVYRKTDTIVIHHTHISIYSIYLYIFERLVRCILKEMPTLGTCMLFWVSCTNVLCCVLIYMLQKHICQDWNVEGRETHINVILFSGVHIVLPPQVFFLLLLHVIPCMVTNTTKLPTYNTCNT